MGRRKVEGPRHYARSSHIYRYTMCGLDKSGVPYASDERYVTCLQCQRMSNEGAVMWPGGGGRLYGIPKTAGEADN
jgi:hypothetical protein